mgnify:CR=1 FL=1
MDLKEQSHNHEVRTTAGREKDFAAAVCQFGILIGEKHAILRRLVMVEAAMQDLIFPLITPLIRFAIVVTMVSAGMQVTGAQILGAISRKGLMGRALLA